MLSKENMATELTTMRQLAESVGGEESTDRTSALVCIYPFGRVHEFCFIEGDLAGHSFIIPGNQDPLEFSLSIKHSGIETLRASNPSQPNWTYETIYPSTKNYSEFKPGK